MLTLSSLVYLYTAEKYSPNNMRKRKLGVVSDNRALSDVPLTEFRKAFKELESGESIRTVAAWMRLPRESLRRAWNSRKGVAIEDRVQTPKRRKETDGVEKRRIRSLSESELQRAYQELERGATIRNVASDLRVPRETLRRMWKNGKLESLALGSEFELDKGGRPFALNEEELGPLMEQADSDGNWGAMRMASAASEILKKRKRGTQLSTEWGRKTLKEMGLKGRVAPRRSRTSLNPPTQVDITGFLKNYV